MNRETLSPDNPGRAVFCVCGDEATVAAALDASAQMPGTQFAGEFRDYITAEHRPQFSSLLKRAAGCVAIVDFDRDPELALETSERLKQSLGRQVVVVGVGSQLDAGLLLRAMRNGCSEFSVKPLVMAELTASLERAFGSMAMGSVASNGMGRVLAFFGAKGGVGTTMLAVHLATHLVGQHAKRTLLIDHKHQLGHVALYLGLKNTQYHFNQLLRNADRLDSELLNGFIIRHKSGLDVIASQESSTSIHEPNGDELERVMDFLRREYDFVLIDSPLAHQDTKARILEQVDEIFLVSTPDVASLRDLARTVENLSLQDAASGKLRLVINRSTATDSVTREQIEKAVRFPISIAIPNNYFELLRAINEGEPIALDRRTEFNQQMARWASQVTGAGGGLEPKRPSRKLFSFLR